ncbi:hypothetical protein KEJ17_02125 [Candidatus Bathyarchaeota archaeon]|nr:hypothetical protein [Candidatus Bathyarchaeota archaeon]
MIDVKMPPHRTTAREPHLGRITPVSYLTSLRREAHPSSEGIKDLMSIKSQ